MNCPQLIFGSVFGISVPHNEAWRLCGSGGGIRCCCCGVGEDERSGVCRALLDVEDPGVDRREESRVERRCRLLLLESIEVAE